MQESGMRRRESMRPLTCIQVEEAGPISLPLAGHVLRLDGLYTSDTGRGTGVVRVQYFGFMLSKQ